MSALIRSDGTRKWFPTKDHVTQEDILYLEAQVYKMRALLSIGIGGASLRIHFVAIYRSPLAILLDSMLDYRHSNELSSWRRWLAGDWRADEAPKGTHMKGSYKLFLFRHYSWVKRLIYYWVWQAKRHSQSTVSIDICSLCRRMTLGMSCLDSVARSGLGLVKANSWFSKWN